MIKKKKAGHLPPAKNNAPIAIPGAHDRVSRDTAIAIIANRVKSLYPEDTFRQVKDKVGKRLSYAIKTGSLEPPVKGRFVLGDIVRWARTKPRWRGKLAGLPQTDLPKAPPMRVQAEHMAIHDLSLKTCHELLAEANDQLRAALDELKRLRPHAEKWEHFMSTRTKGHKKGPVSK